MRRATRIAIGALLMILVAGCLPPVSGAQGSLAPAIAIESVADGKTVGLDDFKGKVVLLEFWATWCGPCHQFAPVVEQFHRKYGPQGLEVVSISNETRSTLESFAKKREHTYPIYRDPDSAAHIAYKIEPIPSVVVIGRDGRIAFAPTEIQISQLEAEIQKALAAN